MKKIVLALFCSLSLFLYAQKTVNVIALNGLNLRNVPSENGIVIAKIPFGTDLKVLNTTPIACKPVLVFKKDSLHPAENKIKSNSDLALTGTFLKVVYKGKIGYINNLFVCAVIPNLFFLNQKSNKDIEYITYYMLPIESNFDLLNAYFKLKKASKKQLAYQKRVDKQKTTTITYARKYPNGLHYRFSSEYTEWGPGGEMVALAAKNLHYNEAVMMANLLFHAYEDKKSIYFLYNEENGECSLNLVDEGSATTIAIYKNDQGYWTLELSYGAC